MNALLKNNSIEIVNAFMIFSISFEKFHKRTCRISELSETIKTTDMSVALATNMKKSIRAHFILRLEALLERKFKIKKTTEDILRAIDYFEESLKLEFNRTTLNLLADSQGMLWKTTSAKADLNRAIDLSERSIKQIPDDIKSAT